MPPTSRPRLSHTTLAARLRPLTIALAAVLLGAGGISPAIALAPSGSAVAPGGPAGVPDPSRAATTPSTVASDVFTRLAVRDDATSDLPAADPVPTGDRPAAHTPEAIQADSLASVAASSSGRHAATIVSGSDHLWIPALGIDRDTRSFPCSRTTAPDNYVYRWGCAGTNNVYLLGHAFGVFKGLHDAYDDGRLKVGLTALYAGGDGVVHTYRVVWWKVVRPTTAASWAWAALAAPGMTLQTCLGADSQYRLMVRLIRVS